MTAGPVRSNLSSAIVTTNLPHNSLSYLRLRDSSSCVSERRALTGSRLTWVEYTLPCTHLAARSKHRLCGRDGFPIWPKRWLCCRIVRRIGTAVDEDHFRTSTRINATYLRPCLRKMWWPGPILIKPCKFELLFPVNDLSKIAVKGSID